MTLQDDGVDTSSGEVNQQFRWTVISVLHSSTVADLPFAKGWDRPAPAIAP
jgi:hypothetical protein